MSPYFIKLPSGRFLNLALVREVDVIRMRVIVIFSGVESVDFDPDDREYLLAALNQFAAMNHPLPAEKP
jgi:hypothetical protein